MYMVVKMGMGMLMWMWTRKRMRMRITRIRRIMIMIMIMIVIIIIIIIVIVIIIIIVIIIFVFVPVSIILIMLVFFALLWFLALWFRIVMIIIGLKVIVVIIFIFALFTLGFFTLFTLPMSSILTNERMKWYHHKNMFIVEVRFKTRDIHDPIEMKIITYTCKNLASSTVSSIVSTSTIDSSIGCEVTHERSSKDRRKVNDKTERASNRIFFSGEIDLFWCYSLSSISWRWLWCYKLFDFIKTLKQNFEERLMMMDSN